MISMSSGDLRKDLNENKTAYSKLTNIDRHAFT